MICMHCGMDNDPGEPFCVECGRGLEAATPARTSLSAPKPTVKPDPVVIPEDDFLTFDNFDTFEEFAPEPIEPVVSPASPTPTPTPTPEAWPEPELELEPTPAPTPTADTTRHTMPEDDTITYVIPEPIAKPTIHDTPEPESITRVIGERPPVSDYYELREPVRQSRVSGSSSVDTKKLLIISAAVLLVIIIASVAALGIRNGWFSRGGEEEPYVAAETPAPTPVTIIEEEEEEIIEVEEVVEEDSYYTEESLFLVNEGESEVEIIGFLGAMEVVRIPPTIAGKTVVAIGENAFDSFADIQEIEIPDTVAIIDDEAFADCVGLATLTLPADLKWIGEYAFWNCRALRWVTIPAGVEYIGEFAFGSCTALDEVYMLGEVAIVGEFAFLKDFIFPESGTRLLNMDDVEGMSETMVQFGRHEILARHGYAFNNDDTQSYFDMWGWYQDLEKKARNKITLSDIEDANRDFLSKYPWLTNEAAMSIAWVMDTGSGARAAFNSVAAAAGGIVAAGSVGENAFISMFDYDGRALWNNEIVIRGYYAGVAAAADGFVAVGGVDDGSLIVKFDYNGNITWLSDYEANGDRFSSVAAVADGIVAVGKARENALIQKYDNSGNVVWRMNYGGAAEEFTAVAALADGLVVTGTSGESALIVRYDNNGNVVWEKTFGRETVAFNAVVPVSDGLVVVGQAASGAFGSGDLADISAKGGTDALIVKYDYNGNVVWRKNFGGSGRDEYHSVAVTADGVIAVGSSGSDSFGGGDWADARGLGGVDSIIVRYDNSGEILWKEGSGSANLDRFHSVTAVLGGVVTAGRTGEYAGDGQWLGDAMILKYDFDN